MTIEGPRICVRCPHTDERHFATVAGGLAHCMECDCSGFFEAITAEVHVEWGCGRCGAAVFDYGLHTAWHEAR